MLKAKVIIQYNGDIELIYNGINNDKWNKFIDWWTTGKINDEISDMANIYGIALNRLNIESIKFKR